MHRLYQAGDRIEAQFLSDLLDSHGIDNTILGDYLSGAIGELPANIYPSVWLIDDADQARAEALLAVFLAEQRREVGASWVCRGCGELIDGSFDLCWHCGGGRRT
jgi:hypothetical protein